MNEDNVWQYNKKISVGFLPDAHCFPGHDDEPVKAVARWFSEQGIDLLVNIGDFNDMPSLSSYDKGTSKIDGLRVAHELEYSREMLDLFDDNLDGHFPEKIMTLGNHEQRLYRHGSTNPELEGIFGDDPFGYKEYGYAAYKYLDIVKINGLAFSHAFVNPLSLIGSLQAGSAEVRMKNVGMPHVCGHQHGPLVHGQRKLGDGASVSTLVIGCCHTESHDYWGLGKDVFRGAAILKNVWNGSYDLEIKELSNLLEEYT